MPINFENYKNVDSLPGWVWEYLDWFTAPLEMREPIHLKDWCEENGVAKANISSLTNSSWWPKILADHTQAAGISQAQIIQVKDALVRKALTGDVKAQELVLRMTGQYTPEQKQITENRDLSKAADEDLAAEYAARLADAAAKAAERVK